MSPARSEELGRLAESMRRHGLDAVLLSTPPNVTYASGFAAPLPVGFVADITGSLPALALVTADGGGQLVVSQADAEAARASSWFSEVTTFEVLRHEEPADPPATFRRAVAVALQAAGLAGTRAVVGVEPTLPWLASRELALICHNAEIRDVTATVEEARLIKTAREIQLIRDAVATADAGQRRLLDIAPTPSAPVTDTFLWAEVTGAMEEHAGRALPVSGSVQTGAATADFTAGGPTGATVLPGDGILLDIGPRVNGYWADCANTVVFAAEPTAEQRRHQLASRAACEAGIAALRPGRRCADVWQDVRAAFDRNGFPIAHYAGHCIGTAVNERPRLVPYDETVIEAGMVFALEAGAYEGVGGTFGCRSERDVLISETGPEVLSAFPWE